MSTIVTTQSRAQVSVDVWTTTVSKATAFSLECLFKVVTGRGLSADHLRDRFQSIEAGLVTWLSMKQLESLRIEAYEDDEIIEKWELSYAYNPTPIGSGQEAPSSVKPEALERALSSLTKLPAGTSYRIVAMLPSNAASVPGWSEAQPLKAGKLVHQDLGPAFDFHHVLGRLQAWVRQ